MRKTIQPMIFLVCFFVFLGCGSNEKDDRFRNYVAFNPQKNFILKDQNGVDFQLKDYRGKIILLFFGYVSCPDVCPTTLSKMTRVYSLLKEKRESVLTVFVSLDPQRDSPEKIKEYLAYFNINAIGLTGTETEIDEVAIAYKIYYSKVETNSALGYMISHTDNIFLIDQEGSVRYLFNFDDKVEKIVSVIEKVL